MRPMAFSFLFVGALLLASCDESISTKPAEPDAEVAAKARTAPEVGFKQVEFGTGGGFAGGGTGEFMRLYADGSLMGVAAKPLQTDSGPRWSGSYDTTRTKISASDLSYADSVLHSRTVLSPAPVPDSAYVGCSTIYDGFYWLATATLASDSTAQWSSGSMGCWDKSGKMFDTPESEAVTALKKLEKRLEEIYFTKAELDE